ncbi:MAG: hypothetical protein MZW92_77830 [Comamonadaceae bacterium]|nr:hypothetical protein [Comamonadaceae bacterium]
MICPGSRCQCAARCASRSAWIGWPASRPSCAWSKRAASSRAAERTRRSRPRRCRGAWPTSRRTSVDAAAQPHHAQAVADRERAGLLRALRGTCWPTSTRPSSSAGVERGAVRAAR